MKLCYFVLSVLIFSSVLAQDESVEETEDNPIVRVVPTVAYQGRRFESRAGEFYAFRGIRYARPPTGELRFKPPVNIARGAEGLNNATLASQPCIQISPYVENEILGQEDCLFLDVYTTKIIRDDEPLPVMVFIHGGGFQGGQPHPYRPDHIVNKNVVMVTMQYRVGPLGFLSTGSPQLPGNLGLLDQISALEWVRNNIDAFGGDKGKITLFGADAGAVSIGMHLVSPQSKGLFHAAILQSGSPLAPYSIQTNPLAQAKEVAKALQCQYDTADAIAMCLATREAKDIIQAEMTAQEILSLHATIPPPYTSAPVVLEPFLPKSPIEVLRTGGEWNYVPIVMGVTQDEGAGDVQSLIMPQLLNYTSIDNSVDLIARALLPNVASVVGMKQNTPGFLEALRFQYFLDDNLLNPKKLESSLVKLHSDLYVTSPAWETAWRMSSKVPVFFYGFDYSGRHPMSSMFPSTQVKVRQDTTEATTNSEEEGAAVRPPPREKSYVMHGEELLYLFRYQHPVTKQVVELDDETDLYVRQLITTLWTNMAKYGMPVPPGNEQYPPWLPLAPVSKRRPFYRVGALPGLQPVFLSRRMAFWNYLVPRLQENNLCQ